MENKPATEKVRPTDKEMVQHTETDHANDNEKETGGEGEGV